MKPYTYTMPSQTADIPHRRTHICTCILYLLKYDDIPLEVLFLFLLPAALSVLSDEGFLTCSAVGDTVNEPVHYAS